MATSFLPKVEELVRMGLMPVQSLALLRQAFRHVERGVYLPTPERKVFYDFLTRMLDTSLNSPTTYRLIRTHTGMRKHMKEDVIRPNVSLDQQTPEIRQKVKSDIASFKARRAKQIGDTAKAAAKRLVGTSVDVRKKRFRKFSKQVGARHGLDSVATFRSAVIKHMKSMKEETMNSETDILEMLGESFGKKDVAVLQAFGKRLKADGKKLWTDGHGVHGNWMGGRNIANWDGKRVRLNDVGSKSGDKVHRALKKHVLAKNDIHEVIKPEIRRPLGAHSQEVQDKVKADLQRHKDRIAKAVSDAATEFKASEQGKEKLSRKTVLKNVFKTESIELPEEYMDLIVESGLLDEEWKSVKDLIKKTDDPNAMDKVHANAKKAGHIVSMWHGENDSLYRVITRTTRKKVSEEETIEDIEELLENSGLRDAPETLLQQLANLVYHKRRAGGRPTEEDKKTATKAKNEMRRRRNNKAKLAAAAESVVLTYEDKYNKALTHFGVENISTLPEDKAGEFFSFIENYQGES